MNAIRRRLLAYYLNNHRGIRKEEILIGLYPYMITHNIQLDKDVIRFQDINTSIPFDFTGYHPDDCIAYSAIVDIREMSDGQCLRILLRSGECHMLDKHSPIRSQYSIYNEPRKPYPGEAKIREVWHKMKRIWKTKS